MVTPAHDQVSELRLVIRADDVDALVAHLRDRLGMPELARFGGGGAGPRAADGPGGGAGPRAARSTAVLLDAGRATIEVGDVGHTDEIDVLETGRAGSPTLRVALEVGDVPAAVDALAGAEVLGEPREMPWGSVNARVRLDAELHVTLFERPEPGGTETFL